MIRKILLTVFVLLVAMPVFGTYTQQYSLSQDATFQGQIMVAMLQTSANVMTENVTVTGHVQRSTFARDVIQNPSKWQPVIAVLIASQSNNPMTPLTVPSTVADSLVQTAVDAQWSNISGYYKQ